MKNSRTIGLLSVLIAAGLFIFTIISFANKTYPYVGHDFEYFVPHLLDSYLHYSINGLTIQWYSPSFGGGLPAYPNPQHVQFTLTELLMMFLSPWYAIWLANAFFILTGFISSYFLFEQVLGFDPLASALGSIIFNVNGFVFSHTVVGHLGYQAFPLLPLLLLVFFHQRISPFYKAIVIALIVSLNIHGGGFYVIVIYILSMLIAVPIIFLLLPQRIEWKNFGITILWTALICIALCGSKLYAVSSFMRWFPREIEDHYDLSLSAGLHRIYFQLFGLSALFPINKFISGVDLTAYIKASLLSRSQEFSLWEFDNSISPAVLILCGLAPLIYLFNKQKKIVTIKIIFLSMISLVGVWLTTEFRLTNGFIYPHLLNLPGVKSLHVNLRFTAAYLFPLALISIIGFNQLSAKLKNNSYSLIAFCFFSIITVGSWSAYFLMPVKYYRFSFDISQADTIYQSIKNGETYPIKYVDSRISDFHTFQTNTSSLIPYEPILGYYLQYFHPLIRSGSASEMKDNYFNITNPASLVFPAENNLYAFERIKISERDKFEQFVNRKQPDWRRPIPQQILDELMQWSAILIPLIILIRMGMSCYRSISHVKDERYPLYIKL